MTEQTSQTPTEVGKVFVRLASLSIGIFQPRCKDVSLSEEVVENHGVKDKNAVRVWKTIVARDKDKELKGAAHYGKIQSAMTAARSTFAENTFPFGKTKNVRLLNMPNFSALNAEMRKAETRFWDAVNAVGAEWDQIVKISKESLNGAARDEDYPSWKDILPRFHFEYSTMPLPTGALLPVSVDEEDAKLLQQEQAEFESRIEAAFTSANKALAERVSRLAADIDDRLSNPKGLKGEAVQKLEKELSKLERLNLLRDAAITAKLAKARERLAAYTPKEPEVKTLSKRSRKPKADVVTEAPAPEASAAPSPASTLEQMAAFQKTLDAFKSLGANVAA